MGYIYGKIRKIIILRPQNFKGQDVLSKNYFYNAVPTIKYSTKHKSNNKQIKGGIKIYNPTPKGQTR